MNIKHITAAALAAVSLVSCSDMLGDGSERYLYDPDLSNKVDSMFYVNGMLKGMQQCIDQNVLVNELRGDLVSTTDAASTDLKRLAQFDIETANKYADSAYVYYRIINNCNYYIAHRDTTLMTGSTAVTMKEYAQAKAIRAWAYLQLCRNYGSVPFYTNPLTTIEDVENAAGLERKNIEQIAAVLCPDLEQYVDQPQPDWGTFDAGTTDAGGTKTVATKKMMIPIHVILGDLYLETNQYAKAAENYFQYLRKNKVQCQAYNASWSYYPDMSKIPAGMRGDNSSSSNFTWNSTYQNDAETITFVPMSTNTLRGTITALPGLFGYNYYTSSDGKQYSDTPSLEASRSYLNLSESQLYIYRTTSGSKNSYGSVEIGDMRWHSTYYSYTSDKVSTTLNVMMKYQNANVQLYRVGGIYLKLAEAVNRMGHPRVAFAVLKDGWNSTLEQDTSYITKDDSLFLKTTLPFLTSANKVIFNDETSSTPSAGQQTSTSTGNQPIHARGCGYTKGADNSQYQYATEVNKKLDALKAAGYSWGATAEDTLKAEMDAVEDLLCDEMALELAFEGSRYGDLCRFAKHKNADNPFAANYGSQWLAAKLAFKNPLVDLTNTENWYLKFR